MPERRPPGVPHPLSWVRRLDDEPWPAESFWETDLSTLADDAERLPDRQLAIELARCAVGLELSLAETTQIAGLDPTRAQWAMDALREEAAPRRGRGRGPLTDSAIYKRLARERRRQGRHCLGCGAKLDPNKRRGTYACSGRCRKRIHDRGGREEMLRQQKELQRRRAAGNPEATDVIVRCFHCSATFEGPHASREFRQHACPGRPA